MILGTISAVDDDNGLQLIIDGEDDPTTKKYTYISSYVPTANDRVLIEEISGSYVIIGNIISDKDLSGIARTAQTAQSAQTAASATVAGSCTGNAATATIASSCSGNSATATRASSAASADSLAGSSSTNGYLVYSVTKEYNSQLGMDIVTNVSLQGSKHNYIYT